MKINVTIVGSVEVDEATARKFRRANRPTLQSSLAYRLSSDIAGTDLFQGRENSLKVGVRVDDELENVVTA